MKPEFLTRLEVELIDEQADKWRLVLPLRYRSQIVGLIEVPAGFETDFASVPRLPLAYALAGNTARKAAVIHDFLYQDPATERDDADAVFLEAMQVSGMPWWRRGPMWLGVRCFGWLFRKG